MGRARGGIMFSLAADDVVIVCVFIFLVGKNTYVMIRWANGENEHQEECRDNAQEYIRTYVGTYLSRPNT